MSILRIAFLLSLIILSSNYTMEDNFKVILKGFEEKKIGKDYLINLLESLRKKKYHRIPNNSLKNQKAFKKHFPKNQSFIEDQYNYKDMFYGIRPLSKNGASLIAIYNVLHHFNKKKINFHHLIKSFEKDGIILDGAFGTSIKAVEEFFTKKGYKTESSKKQINYEDIVNKTDASIFTFYEDDDNLQPIHFVAITKENGKFYVHNYRDIYMTAFDSINEVLKVICDSEKIREISLIGIYKK